MDQASEKTVSERTLDISRVIRTAAEIRIASLRNRFPIEFGLRPTLPQHLFQILWPGRVQLLDGLRQGSREHPEFGIVDPPQPCFDLGDPGAADVPALELQLRGERILGQVGLDAKPPDTRADDVLVVGGHCSVFGA